MLWDNIIVWIMAFLTIAATALFQMDAPISFAVDHGLGDFAVHKV